VIAGSKDHVARSRQNRSRHSGQTLLDGSAELKAFVQVMQGRIAGPN